jgi:hypothetical protein
VIAEELVKSADDLVHGRASQNVAAVQVVLLDLRTALIRDRVAFLGQCVQAAEKLSIEKTGHVRCFLLHSKRVPPSARSILSSVSTFVGEEAEVHSKENYEKDSHAHGVIAPSISVPLTSSSWSKASTFQSAITLSAA